MIAYDFVAESIESLDHLQTEIVVLPFFEDERPLSGAAGLIDWRLCGALSRKLMAGYLHGHFAEKGMIAYPPKLEADALLLVGLGPSASFDASLAAEACNLIGKALDDAKVSTAALALPGRSLGLLEPLEAMQIWLATRPSAPAVLGEVSIVERAEEHRKLASLFDGLRRQAESPLD